MSRVIVDISMSLDGYVTGPNAGLGNGLGDGGMPLHEWVHHGAAEDRAILDAAFERTGALVQGRNLFDVIDAPGGWSDETGDVTGPSGEANPPVFVVTRSAPAQTRLGDRFRFVTDGVANAVEQALEVADGKDVVVMGGGQICHEVLAAGLADVLLVHVANVVLGAGTRLFPAEPSESVHLELTESISTPAAQHLTYRVVKK
ncbi:dihydrofolate reductase [Kribbella qitaiheensis]|uniref:Dihydrofolate reductase n=1 Tax=Kribbella qitaiheensis TaxID=1544730 RepID=A0A7G6WY38_9ACTN|nr:dihydrofolate reductase family protein [Kribbella qitaiheensis]QNE18903.1 dihydrofolate reductase [Kribbella qitaiheensis]